MRWNTITKVSRWGAAIVFLIFLPIVSFHIGRQYERTMVDISHVEELADAASRMYYTSQEYRIRVELPAAWKSYDVVEVRENRPWFLPLAANVKALQFYAPTTDLRYQTGDPTATSPVIHPADWSERKAGKAVVFELLIFPTSDWSKMQEILKEVDQEGNSLSRRITNSFAGEEYAYIFLGRDEYPSDIREYLYMPSVRDIRILSLKKSE